jgi:hypothetical protein
MFQLAHRKGLEVREYYSHKEGLHNKTTRQASMEIAW